MPKQIDFLAVGDIVIDQFIKLKDASVHCKINNEDCEICMRWGDKIPFESMTEVLAVGNAANAAVAAARLGLGAGLRAYVGNDENGAKCIASLERDGVSTALVETQAGKHTNYHFVLWYEDNRTILVKHEAFDYSVPPARSGEEGPQWLYLSSLAQNSLPYEQATAAWLAQHPGVKLAFQPGTFQIEQGVEALKDIYQQSDIFFCNKEEAEKILHKPAGSETRELLRGVQALGPKVVVISDDTRGAYAREESGASWHVPRYPDPRPPREITGAGDALASTTVAALALGKPLGEALLWGATNASAVLQEIGAQKGLLSREQLEHNLQNPPAAFALQKME
ncbi:MAG: PfkB family carbohydrate kinase [bacterium]|nr:PfkB family carbohydrate kinase [bacterium]